jgi:hypothetical protein
MKTTTLFILIVMLFASASFGQDAGLAPADPNQAGGSGGFFRTLPMARLAQR